MTASISTFSSTETSLVRPKSHPMMLKYFREYAANNDDEISNVLSLNRIFASFIDSRFSDGEVLLFVIPVIDTFLIKIGSVLHPYMFQIAKIVISREDTIRKE
jgi:Sec-independent protein secretion pathway component TatC